jgi:DNA polymerase III subunit epsilon
MVSNADSWATAPLTALDLEGSGAQDREHETILEIAVIPLVTGLPDIGAAYATPINPGRPIRRKPWISPGLTNAVLAVAPDPAGVGHELASRINGRFIIGHNVGMDWRLLHRRYPQITPAGLIDTLRLARYLKRGTKHSLGALVDAMALAPRVKELAPGSQPHRALWDTAATALLLAALINSGWPDGITLGELLDIAALDIPGLAGAAPRASRNPEQDNTLFD